MERFSQEFVAANSEAVKAVCRYLHEPGDDTYAEAVRLVAGALELARHECDEDMVASFELDLQALHRRHVQPSAS